jgi:hypothetical protein
MPQGPPVPQRLGSPSSTPPQRVALETSHPSKRVGSYSSRGAGAPAPLLRVMTYDLSQWAQPFSEVWVDRRSRRHRVNGHLSGLWVDRRTRRVGRHISRGANWAQVESN